MKKIKCYIRNIVAWGRKIVRQMKSSRPADREQRKPNEEPAAYRKPNEEPAAYRKPNEKPAAYREPDEKPADSKRTKDSFRADIIRFNEQFLSERYLLRYNTMKGITEFREKQTDDEEQAEGTEARWQPLTERDLNRLTVEQLKAGGQSWSYGMKLLVESSSVTEFNPVVHYLDSCPEWDGEDHIGALAQRVPTSYALWTAFFHRWILAMVAQVRGMSREHGNALVPMLIGKQGTHKSTFCKIIIPAEMREYYMDDIKMDNAEQVERVLGRMWLVNIDEYNAKTTRELAKIKRLLTEKDVQVRRMRSDQYRMTQRLCSFIATTNERQPLTDPTGSRRYLCVEVEGIIDTETPLNHRQLFAQAQWELEHGHTWWLSKDEEQAMEEHNSQFQQLTSADWLLATYWQPAEVSKDTLVTATDILSDLQARVQGSDKPTLRQLLASLKNLHFTYGAQRGRHGWYARKLGNNAQK
jgi:hypothetical protein